MRPLPKRLFDHLIANSSINEGLIRRVALASELAAAEVLDGHRQTLSGADLGRRLGISRAAVHKHMQQLQDLGFAITPVARTGYRLTASFADLIVAEAALPYLLEGSAAVDETPLPLVGLPYRYVASCASTNVLLRDAAAAAPSGTVLVTDDQTVGRGRLGRGWISQPGKDLTVSVLVRPALAPARAHLLSLAAALAVIETVETLPGLEGRVGLKWPNDVLVAERKVCGILLEGSMDADRLQWAIIGIGLNVNSRPESFIEDQSETERRQWLGRPWPTSLAAEAGAHVPRAPLFAKLLGALAQKFGEVEGKGAHDMLAAVRERDLLRGRAVEVFAGPLLDDPVGGGIAEGIGDEGQLLVRAPGGELTTVYAGDVTLRSPAGAA